MHNQKILSIQALRAVAAMLVVFCHSEQYTSYILNVHVKNYLGQSFGNFGVDIFFVISGFIMVYISHNNFGQAKSILPFLRNRFIRIFPIYWLASIIMLLCILPSGLYSYALPAGDNFVVSSVNNFKYVVNSFLLVPTHGLDNKVLPPIISVAWTLVYEMFFYYIFSLLLFFNRKTYLKILCAIFTSLLFMNYIINTSHFMPFAKTSAFSFYLAAYGKDIILEFIFGCFIAERYLAGKILSINLAILCMSIAISMLVISYHIPEQHYWELKGIAKLSIVYHVRAVGLGIPSMLLVYATLSLENQKRIIIPSVLVKLGNASYSIYLIHLSISLVLLLSFFKKFNSYVGIPGDVAVLIAWVINVTLGCLTYKYIEKPLTRFFNTRLWQFSKPVTQVQVPS